MSARLPTSRLGTTGLEITRLGLGSWAMGGGGWHGGWGPQDDEESIATVHRAVERGVSWIDTAAVYGLGHAEEVVGEALRRLPADRRPSVFTSCGLVWEPGATAVSNALTPASVRRECDDSLRRLGVERIDLYKVHWPPSGAPPIEDSWSAMGSLVDEGKVASLGVSNFDTSLLARCEAVRHVDVCQPELSMLVREAAGEAMPWCVAHGTEVVVHGPLRSGLLSGAFSPERAASLAPGDWRRAHADFREPALSRHLDLAARLELISVRLRCTVAELVVAWALAWSGVTAVAVGARRPDQVDGWIGAASVELGVTELYEISQELADGLGRGPTHPAAAG